MTHFPREHRVHHDSFHTCIPGAGNQSLPRSCYLQNASGHFIGYDGLVPQCRQPRLLVTKATRAKYCPDALFAVEGDGFRQVYSSGVYTYIVVTWQYTKNHAEFNSKIKVNIINKTRV